jgi:hypothetical protein
MGHRYLLDNAQAACVLYAGYLRIYYPGVAGMRFDVV